MSRRFRASAWLMLALLLWCAGPAAAQSDTDKMRNAKALFFDRNYAEARRAWQAVLVSAHGADADAAAYWIARCSENLDEPARALAELGEFLARHPADAALAEEARTSRAGLAARLYKSGQRQHLGVLKEALADPSRNVRYYAALQMATLGSEAGRAAIPLLLQIVKSESDEDLVERAKLGLLRLDPDALSRTPARVEGHADAHGNAHSEARWLKVRITEKGKTRPKVSINVPVALAQMLFGSLPEEARRSLKEKGYDAENFWQKLAKLGPTQIIDIEGEDGEKVEIWIE
jgi:hypothetical protein